MNKVHMIAWLAEHQLGYKMATNNDVTSWATETGNEREFTNPENRDEIRLKSHPKLLPFRWDPIEKMDDAWKLMESMISDGYSPFLVFDDNLVEEDGAWCCTCEGWNSVPDSERKNIDDLVFTGICKNWYPTPALAICACAAYEIGMILSQSGDQYELHVPPAVELPSGMQTIIDNLYGDKDES